MVKVVPDKVAIMGIDPGGTTGVAAAHLQTAATVRETLEGSHIKAVEVKGNWLQQARTLDAMIGRFVYIAHVELSIPYQDIHLAIED